MKLSIITPPLRKGEFYTYVWLRADGTPFYVGKGTWRSHRFISQERAFRKGSPSPERIIIQHHPTEADAFFCECFLIEFYGRKSDGSGCLRNLTGGGEGLKGHSLTQDHRQKISSALKEHRKIHPIRGFDPKRHSQMMTGSGNPMFGKKRVFDPEWCRRLSEGKMGHGTSEETRKKMSDSAKRRWRERRSRV